MTEAMKKFGLSPEDIEEARKYFKEVDVDGNGSLSPEEIIEIMKDYYPEPVIHVMIAMGDTDGDGKLNFEEFIQLSMNGPPEDWSEEQMFKIFDKDGDGFITVDEMRKLILTF